MKILTAFTSSVDMRQIPLAATQMSQLQLDQIAAVDMSVMCDEDIVEMNYILNNTTIGDYVIIIHNELLKRIDRSVLAMLIDHEMAHIKLGHMDSFSLDNPDMIEVAAEDGVNKGYICVNNNNEIEADAYAASIHGPARYLAGLKDFLMIVAEMMCEGNPGTSVYLTYKNMLEGIKDRIEALEAMI